MPLLSQDVHISKDTKKKTTNMCNSGARTLATSVPRSSCNDLNFSLCDLWESTEALVWGILCVFKVILANQIKPH